MSTLRVDSIRGQTAGTDRYVVQVVITTTDTSSTTLLVILLHLDRIACIYNSINLSNNKVLVMGV